LLDEIWRNGITRKRKAERGEKIYLIKATLLFSGRYDVKGRPYRVLAIPQRFTLYRLAEAIVKSFGFYFDHPFGFYDNMWSWTESQESYEIFSDLGINGYEGHQGVRKTKTSKAFDKIRKKMLFLFDYGDEWHFAVELKGIESPKENVSYPLTVKSVGEAPPQYG